MSTHTHHYLITVTLFLGFSYQIVIINSLTFDFYQRDSFGSPFYNASLSKSDIIRRAIARSVNKLNKVTPNSPTANIFSRSLEYLIKIRLGTPPVDIIGVADTGSSLTWTQCKPFTKSIPQRMPLFDVQISSTYAKIPCSPTKNCPYDSYSKCKDDGLCHYKVHYMCSTYSKGLLSMEMMRMDSTNGHVIEIPNFIFGCGTDSDGYLAGGESSGVIGLGDGPESLVSQLGELSMQRFSYCLVPLDLHGKVSHIRFGRDANVHGLGTLIVPLLTKKPPDSYYTTIQAFTIGGIRIECTGLTSGKVDEGNIMIDSGSTVIEVPRHLYERIKHTVIMIVNEPPVDDPYNLLNLCFAKTSSLRLPYIVANFRSGNVHFQQYNVFAHFGTVICLAFQSSDDELSVYGSMAQQNFIVGFDLNARTISLKPFDCTQY